MPKRHVFFSFHYAPDVWRAAQVRNMGLVEGNAGVSDNAWERVTSGGKAAIRRWIERQMHGRSCTIVLVGSETAGREWINYEIIKSWNDGKGLVGIRIHGLTDQYQYTTRRGSDPFDYIEVDQVPLSSIVKCYDPPGPDSRDRYAWIEQNLAAAVEEAIEIRSRYP